MSLRAIRAGAMLALAAACPALAVAPAAARSSAMSCSPARHTIGALRGLVTVRDNVRVWVAREHTISGRPGFGTRYYACWKPTHRAHLISANSGGAATTDVAVKSVVLSGRYVAFHLPACGDENYDEYRSLDAQSGVVRRTSDRLPREARCDGTFPAARLRVAADNGAIAWLQDGILSAADGAGTRTLASAATGRVTGLTLRGHTLRWTQGGAPYAIALS